MSRHDNYVFTFVINLNTSIKRICHTCLPKASFSANPAVYRESIEKDAQVFAFDVMGVITCNYHSTS